MKRRVFDMVTGFGLAVVLAYGCASTNPFPWPYYAPQMPDGCYDQGVLLGKLGTSGWPDRSMSLCKPDPDPSPIPSGDPTPTPAPSPVKLKCMLVFIDDFYSIQADDIKCHADLELCQQGPAPSPTSVK